MELQELIEQRRQKLEALRQSSLPIYPANAPSHTDVGELVKDFKEATKATVCGRITAKRSHGKVTFLDLKDATGRIQLYLKADAVGIEAAKLFENIDIADFISVTGDLFKTHTGEPTIKVEGFTLLAKALRPLPEKWHGLKDVDLRYRQRYLDLLSNEEVKKVFSARSRIIACIRRFLDGKGFLEVETPMMHTIPGGAAGRPFTTHHNEYDMQLFLRIAPELYLKRLLVGGLDKVYEINRSFRNEGVSTRHNPEFTMLEVYAAYADYRDMMQLSEELIVAACREARGTLTLAYQGKEIDFTPPWQRVSFAGLVKEKFDIDPLDPAEVTLSKLHARGYARDTDRLSHTQVSKVIEDLLQEGMSARPTFVTDYFASMSPLAKTRPDDPGLSERFELFAAGFEIGNAYSEQNDPWEQRRRFEEEVQELAGEEKKSVDEEYVTALEHGMPPAGGLGIGIDRLVMLLTDQASIRDVILFPLLRPSAHEGI